MMAPTPWRHSDHGLGTQWCGGFARGQGLCYVPPTAAVLEDEILHGTLAEDAEGLDARLRHVT